MSTHDDDIVTVARALVRDMGIVEAEPAAHRLLRDFGDGCGHRGCTICSAPPERPAVIPSTAYVRDSYIYAARFSNTGAPVDQTDSCARDEFYAWLTTHDRQVAAGTLRAMADDTRVSDWYGPNVTNEHDSVAGTVCERLRSRAERIEIGQVT